MHNVLSFEILFVLTKYFTEQKVPLCYFAISCADMTPMRMCTHEKESQN